MKKILIVCHNHLKSDPRVQRHIEALKEDFHIETLALSDCGIGGIINYQIYKTPTANYIRKFKRMLQFFLRFYDQFYWDQYRLKIAKQMQENNYQLIIANDIQTLPLALKIANKKCPVLFDSHDFHPNEFDDNFLWRIKDKRYINYLCKKYIPKATKFITSSESISNEYKKYIGSKPDVIDNAREYYQINPTEVHFPIKMVHHGAAIEGRKLENMIKITELLGEKYVLYFMLTNQNSTYYNFLVNRAKKIKNVFFIEPVPYDNIVTKLNEFDIGLYHLEESNINNSNLLPNKIFEFIQARLCCVVSPTKELKRIVLNNNIGIVCENFSPQKMAEEIRKLSTDEIMNYKIEANMKAFKLSSEANLKKINLMVKDLIAE